MTRTELIAALEKLTAPSRELDAEIAKLCGVSWSSDEDGNFGGYGIMPQRVRFTHSVDSALSLVPEGWSYFVEHIAVSGEATRATIADVRSSGRKRLIEMTSPNRTAHLQLFTGHDGWASTAAIALCIASLRARGDCREAHQTTP